MFQMLCDRHSLCPNLKSASSQKQGVKGYVFFFFFFNHISKRIGVCNNTIHVSKHGWGGGRQLYSWHHFSSVFGEQNSVIVVGSDSDQYFSFVAGHHLHLCWDWSARGYEEGHPASLSWGGEPFVPGSRCLSQVVVLPASSSHAAVVLVWQLCANQSISFNSPGHQKRETLFRGT